MSNLSATSAIIFGDSLKKRLEEKQMSMTNLANQTGITYNMIKKYCAGQAEPTVSYASEIAKALGTTVDYLIGGSDPGEKDMFRKVFEENFSYIAGFMRVVRRYGNNTAMYDPVQNKSWTYYELNAEANRLANALLKSGVKKGDVVLYQLFNSAEFVFSYLSPQKIGAVTSPANYNFSAGETAICFESSRPKVYIYDVEIKDLAVKAIEISKHKPDIIIMTGDGELPAGHLRYNEYVEGCMESEPDTEFVPHIYGEVMRLYTSGTTGRPKGVPLNNANEVLTCHDIAMHFPLNATDVTMNMTPWFHRGGIHSGGPAPTFFCGGKVIILRAFLPQLCLKYTEEYGITFLIGVPAVIKMLVRSQERFGADLSSLRGIVTMGAPFERADCIKVQNVLTPNVFNGYGTTESFWNTFLRPYDLPEMSGSAGRACTDDEVRVVKIYEGRKAEPDDLALLDGTEVGEVIIRTPKSSYRYYQNSEEEAKKFYKGWIYTGDLGTWDAQQYITIAGRKDDMLISGGENIYPPVIEEVLNAHPKVHLSAVTGVPDSARGEAVVAYIISDDETLTVEELADFCLDSNMLSAYKRPRYYRFVKELPMTATGKLQHYLVKEMAANDQEMGMLKLAVPTIGKSDV
ncbi:AMP-binding protein [Parasporobacterium paucivorans]|uniref:Acyl-CoA synthetase (AMP-forming)/AMP-acid ligase II n=1 Tax=Parasporobacterium paucivorans DSM 15970 TaxID=1122934 RepID=A0A1M6IFW7_9FIRM|nr:AMP-binding protein [Parasporobacterium paucivorans]SHJ33293.1 Acyl-CoA synthetase (AMP-forming)/AMP-acid ligase II [Parasporobacterium paucivorans DSM 15970]